MKIILVKIFICTTIITAISIFADMNPFWLCLAFLLGTSPLGVKWDDPELSGDLAKRLENASSR